MGKMKKIKVLMSGFNGRLGTALRAIEDCYVNFVPLQTRFPSVNCQRNEKISFPALVECEFLEHDDTKPVDLFLNCAALTDVCYCELNPEECIDVNALSLIPLVKICDSLEIPFIQISTDHVFDGRVGMYSEQALCTPQGWYAKSKVLAEGIVVSEKSSRNTVIRTSFIKDFTLENAFIDKYFSGDTINIIAQEILLAIKMVFHEDLYGIVNIGTGRKSIYHVAKKINPSVGKMRLEDNPVNKVGLKYLEDTSLDTSKWEYLKSG